MPKILNNDSIDSPKVRDRYHYSENYRVRSIQEQVAVLMILFPNLKEPGKKFYATAKKKLPKGAEGYFAIPRWEAVAPTYSISVERVCAMLKAILNRNFVSYETGRMNDKNIYQTERTRNFLAKIAREQSGEEILVIPAQLGLRHAGQSVEHARTLMEENEFDLGAFAVGIILLTHLKMMTSKYKRINVKGDTIIGSVRHSWSGITIACGGDEYSWYGNGKDFDFIMCFGLAYGSASIDKMSPRVAFPGTGDATGFLCK